MNRWRVRLWWVVSAGSRPSLVFLFFQVVFFISSSKSCLLNFQFVTHSGICTYWLNGHTPWIIQVHFSMTSKYWVVQSYLPRGSHFMDRERISSVFKQSNIEIHLINYEILKEGNWKMERCAIYIKWNFAHLKKIINSEIYNKMDE